MMLTKCGDLAISWHEAGRGNPVILIHGLGDDHRAWRKVVGDLMLDHRVILYDLRGHGESGLGQPNGSLAQLAGDLIALMDAIDLDSATLSGFSLGGTVAMRAAIDHPGRVDALALVATSSRVNALAAEWYTERAEAASTGAEGLRAMLDRDTEDVYRHRPDEIPAGLAIRRQSTADPAGYANACRAMARLRQESLDPELGRITAPTIVVAAEDDQHCPPRAGEIIVNAIAGSELIVLPDTGHPVPIERPAEVVAAISRLDSPATP
jgi:3-oxoadipate enol-lactonase